MHVLVGQRLAEFLLQYLFHRSDHEVHDRFGGINDSMSIRYIDRKSLKKPFVNIVKKGLFLGEGLYGIRAVLKCPVKMIEPAQEFFAAERLRSESEDHLLDLSRDHIALNEL